MLESKRAALVALEEPLAQILARHVKRNEFPWTPDEMVFPSSISWEERIGELRDAAWSVPLAARAVYGLNLLTEEGLSSYFQLLAQYLGLESIFQKWIYRWTAEEQRHGQLLSALARLSGLIPYPSELERNQFIYNQAGFRPRWEGDPYQLLAYTPLQEDFTKISHGRTSAEFKKASGRIFAEPLGYIAKEENYHAQVYAEIVERLFQLDPDEMLISLRKALGTFAMPGVAMPHYGELAEVAMRLGIFTPMHMKETLEKFLLQWKVADIAPRTLESARAKDTLFRLPNVWERQARRLALAEPRVFSFSFLGSESFVL